MWKKIPPPKPRLIYEIGFSRTCCSRITWWRQRVHVGEEWRGDENAVRHSCWAWARRPASKEQPHTPPQGSPCTLPLLQVVYGCHPRLWHCSVACITHCHRSQGPALGCWAISYAHDQSYSCLSWWQGVALLWDSTHSLVTPASTLFRPLCSQVSMKYELQRYNDSWQWK